MKTQMLSLEHNLEDVRKERQVQFDTHTQTSKVAKEEIERLSKETQGLQTNLAQLQQEKEKHKAVQAAKEALEAELESLSQALFEEVRPQPIPKTHVLTIYSI